MFPPLGAPAHSGGSRPPLGADTPGIHDQTPGAPGFLNILFTRRRCARRFFLSVCLLLARSRAATARLSLYLFISYVPFRPVFSARGHHRLGETFLLLRFYSGETLTCLDRAYPPFYPPAPPSPTPPLLFILNRGNLSWLQHPQRRALAPSTLVFSRIYIYI